MWKIPSEFLQTFSPSVNHFFMNDNNQVIDFLDDMYGSAPWMGTLRHVKHENKVTASLPKPQFKRYPDEDAPNPFEGIF